MKTRFQRETFGSKGELRYIDIIDPNVVKILKTVFKNNPRTFSFQNDQHNLGMNNNTLLNYLRRIAFIKQIKMDMMRSIYMTPCYNK